MDANSNVDIDAALNLLGNREEINFIFLGAFSPGRGLEDLVKAWARVDSRGRLFLRGPDSSFKKEIVELAKSLDLTDRSVFFPAPVTEEELIHAARQADIGIIPYSPRNIVYRYACPNKLSQYMAAGLPIICNEITYVKSVVSDNGIGVAVDFSDHAALAKVVNSLLSSKEQIVEMSRRSQEAFRTSFNWGTVSKNLYCLLRSAVSARVSPSELNLDWMDQKIDMHRSGDELGSAIAIFPQSAAAYQEQARAYEAECERLVRVYDDLANAHERLVRAYQDQGSAYQKQTRAYQEQLNVYQEQSERLIPLMKAIIRAIPVLRRFASFLRNSGHVRR